MIIGNGLLAKAFKESEYCFDEVIVFASGVSNSNETNKAEFNRELKILTELINNNKTKKFIYFSCVLTDIIDSPYYNHKQQIESIIKRNCKNYVIFRIPQIVGPIGNKENLVNLLYNKIISNEVITVYENAVRALIDVDDLVKIVVFAANQTKHDTLILSHIEKSSVIDIVNIISDILNVKPNINVVKSDNINWEIPNSEIINSAISVLETDLETNENYTKKILKKYI